ncbi:MAG: hypothetical protein KKG99_05845 [Bacteroidetes bacterium]|nr:hypothetical protein [Bacteroidota bacterium]
MKAFKNHFNFSKKPFYYSSLILLTSILLLGFTIHPNDALKFGNLENINEENTTIHLNLRVHIMQDITMIHSTGVIMKNWITPSDIKETIMPEVNAIWKQANIQWDIESIIEENVVKGDTYEESLTFIAGTKRDSEGRSDAERLPHLYKLMQPQNMSKADELDKNLFHIYLFPFIGNTSQGNAMRPFNWSTVVGTWTNKHNRGGIPEKTALTEDHNSFKRGSLSRTIAHEIGHVLSLKHNECETGCLMGGKSQGYLLTDEQIEAARLTASKRLK